MKKLILPVAALACLAATALSLQPQATAQNAPKTATATANLPVKVGLVDMAKIFKEYEKFSRLREGLQSEMTAIQDEAKGVKASAQKIADQMKQLNADSTEYRALEEKLAKMTSEFETKIKLKQRDLARREAEIFETIYLEATDVVKKYAEHFKFTMVIRFNSESLESDNPQKLATNLNKLVVYHRPEDDITDPVIEYLNRQFISKSGAAAPDKVTTKPEDGVKAPVRKQ